MYFIPLYICFLIMCNILISGGKKGEVRITDSDANGGGRAEIYWGGSWGTICDKVYNNQGWPLVFCQQLGFEKAEASKASKKNLPESSVNVAFMGPSCSPSNAESMADCGSDNQPCDHQDDVYIYCFSKLGKYLCFFAI